MIYIIALLLSILSVFINSFVFSYSWIYLLALSTIFCSLKFSNVFYFL